MHKNILIVCLGNICRSPMAEALFKARAKELKLAIDIGSAGLAALSKHTIDPNIKALLLKKGIEFSHHEARQVTEEMLKNADLILVMDKQQQRELISKYYEVKNKVHLLGEWDNVEIPDPYLQNKDSFEKTYELIKNAVDAWQSKIWK